MQETHKIVAERYFRGVYGGRPSVVDELAAADIVASYPVFEEIFGAPTIRGRAAVKAFAVRFSQQWTDARITIHQAIAEDESVVLLWSFRARRVGAAAPDTPAPPQEHRWGGITLFRFDGSNQIVAEIGEESAPGPAARTKPGR